MTESEANELKRLKKNLLGIDLSGTLKHVVFSIIASIFLGAVYYCIRWKLIGIFLLFFLGYGLLGILIITLVVAFQVWGLKRIKEKEEKVKLKNDDLDF